MKVQIKLKPWGKEIWFAHTKQYAGKILCLKKGHRFSLQYHEKKTETQYIYKGSAKLTFGNKKNKLTTRILKTGDKIDILPYTIHRIQALSDLEIFEVSTPELNDVVKIEDDYGRNGKGNNETLDKKLAKNRSTKSNK
ncbi:MAG: cupin [Candidatus Peregrinibacteria bacterium GW2011_GWC2_39_14]|nr:MAG: cupin [Candidatus Peregrinibacteria bacterium GW2011_GWC2_39_14]